MRWFGLALALTVFASPAAAEYIFDPADVPENFTCEVEWSAEKCAEEREYEGWSNRYSDQYDHWFHDLLYNVNIYFDDARALPATQLDVDDEDWDPEFALGRTTTNLVDVVYSVALRRYSGGWAFAVEEACTEILETTSPGCAPKLRMVSFIRRNEVSPARWEELMKQSEKLGHPTNRAEVAAQLRISAKWEEADLSNCKGALDHLLAFPAQKGSPIWHPGYVNSLRGKAVEVPDVIIVTADGSGVFVRASSRGDPADPRRRTGGADVVYSQWNGGEAMDWAIEMAEKVEPCLKPATAKAPWDKIVEAQGK